MLNKKLQSRLHVVLSRETVTRMFSKLRIPFQELGEDNRLWSLAGAHIVRGELGVVLPVDPGHLNKGQMMLFTLPAGLFRLCQLL